MSRLEKVREASTTVIALAAALVVALGVIVWLALGQRSEGEDLDAARATAEQFTARDDAGKAALDAARAVLVQITTYSYRDGEHEFAWLDQIADPALRQRLAPNVDQLKKAIVDGQVTAKGQVLDAAARPVSADQVEVLAFVDQAISDGGPAQDLGDVKVEEQRVSMTMKRTGGRWLVERLELLSGTNASGLDPAAGASSAPSSSATP
ncbi:hypothetical protein [Nocardioides sp.]|uniref:hypothetical protein n=1 Tax=Nocardioides sp. TaxID=35761 RepID=UPI0035157885